MTQALEIRPIGIVGGGRTEPADDHWTGNAIIRLDPAFPPKSSRDWRSSAICSLSGISTRHRLLTSCCTRAVRGTILPGQSQERS